jgi:hypothetical protein
MEKVIATKKRSWSRRESSVPIHFRNQAGKIHVFDHIPEQQGELRLDSNVATYNFSRRQEGESAVRRRADAPRWE